MTAGPGKYDHLATMVREASGARMVVLIILAGHRGDGFSVQTDVPDVGMLPRLLRSVADEIERDLTSPE